MITNVELALEKTVARIEARLLETKTPCKLYSTSSRAAKSTEKVADAVLDYYGVKSITRHFVKISSINKYAVVFNLSPVLNESGGDATYLARQGFYCI